MIKAYVEMLNGDKQIGYVYRRNVRLGDGGIEKGKENGHGSSKKLH